MAAPERPLGCRAVRSRLDAWVDGRLGEATRGALEAHLQDCPRCGGAARRLARLVTSLRRAPRARAPRRPPPLSLTLAPAPPPQVRRLSPLRVAAAVLFLLVLGGTHYAVYRAGQAEAWTRPPLEGEMEAALRAFLERADTHLRFARTVARERPEVLRRLVLEDPAAAALQRSAWNFARFAAHSRLRALRADLEAYARTLAAAYRAGSPTALAHLVDRAHRLHRRLLVRVQGWPPPPRRRSAPPARGEVERVRRALHHLLADRPEMALAVVRRQLARHRPRYPASWTFIVSESGARLGELRDGELVVRLLRSAPRAQRVLQEVFALYSRRGRPLRVRPGRDVRVFMRALGPRGESASSWRCARIWGS